MHLKLHGLCTRAAIHALLRLRGMPLQGCGFIIISGGGPFASAACHARPAATHAPTAAPLRHRIGTRSQQRRAPPCCQAPAQHPLKLIQRSLSSRLACRGALQPRKLLSYRIRVWDTSPVWMSSVKRFARLAGLLEHQAALSNSAHVSHSHREAYNPLSVDSRSGGGTPCQGPAAWEAGSASMQRPAHMTSRSCARSCRATECASMSRSLR